MNLRRSLAGQCEGGNEEKFGEGACLVDAREFRGNGPPMTGSEVGWEGDVTDGLAVEGGDLVADAVEHPFHLVITPFVERESGGIRGEDFQDGGLGSEIFGFEIETGRETGGRIGWDGIAGRHVIDFGHLERRVHEGLGPTAVVGKEHQSGGVAVETADEMERGFVGVVNEVEHSRVDGVGGGTEHPHGFMQHEAQATGGRLHDGVVECDFGEPVDLLINLRG